MIHVTRPLLLIVLICAGSMPLDAQDVVVFDDFDDGDWSEWGLFEGNRAEPAAEISGEEAEQGSFYLSTVWEGAGSSSVFYGGMFWNLEDTEQLDLPLDPWVNILVRHHQSGTTIEQYTLELTVREDLDGNGWTDGAEDTHRLDTIFGADAFNNEWTLVSAPLRDFIDLKTGGNGVIDGPLDEFVVVISQVEGPNPSTLVLDLDFIAFSGGGPASLTMTAVLEEEGQPQAYSLGQAFPNPSNSTTVIPFQLANPGQVRIELFDALGQRVRVLAAGDRPAGAGRVSFVTHGLATGSYFYRMEAGGFLGVGRVLLLR